MKFAIICISLFLVAEVLHAQDFVTRGKIEYEVKRNIKRMMADHEQDNSITMAMPEFAVSYQDLVFSWNRWVYQPGKAGPNLSPFQYENSAYIDLDAKEKIVKKRFIDDYFVFSDGLLSVKWRIEQETRKIAGWECRKAIGRIYDSVYVVAFYCPEIVTQGGPEFFNGLPGMILGLAIPRYYTTWFATKIEIANIDESKIVPPTVKKGKQYKSRELAEQLFKQYKDAGWWKDVTLEKVIHNVSGYLLIY